MEGLTACFRVQRVEAGAVVHEGAIVGDGAVVHSGGVLGPEVELGSRSRVGYSASLENCSVGQDCVLHSGVRVGQDGNLPRK
jgi:UDP-3-O-[3-hydroxymyristoyl] glucosamine N-acyltransferase